MSVESDQLRKLILGMRDAYARGENVMAYARSVCGGTSNEIAATLLAYDLQTGTYTEAARKDPEAKRLWCRQLSSLIAPYLQHEGSVLELGCGEATTLQGVLSVLGDNVSAACGFDLSWSRVAEGKRWLEVHGRSAELFVGDLFNIPLADSSIDIVYSSHSLEPNRGREAEAIAECLRVARRAVVLVEPLHELANEAARERMDRHGYVRGLRAAAEGLDAEVMDYRLLEHCPNPLNPSGVLALRKTAGLASAKDVPSQWICPLTGVPLVPQEGYFYADAVGIAYPVLRGIPLLRPEHAVVASGIAKT